MNLSGFRLLLCNNGLDDPERMEVAGSIKEKEDTLEELGEEMDEAGKEVGERIAEARKGEGGKCGTDEEVRIVFGRSGADGGGRRHQREGGHLGGIG